MRKYLDRELIRKLHSKGLNDNQIAREIGASINGVRYVRKDVLHLPHNKRTFTINSDMESVIIGTLLGDAWVGFVHSGCKYPKYQTFHTERQYIYLMNIYQTLEDIMTPTISELPERETIIKGRRCTRHKLFGISSRNCDALLMYREAFYKDGKKIIPVNFIRDKFTEKSLAYWFMDDGSLDKSKNSYIFNTQCFSRDNLQELIDFLKDKYNLQFTIKKDNSLYLRHCCNVTFEQLISKYITPDMQYKLVSSLNSVKQGNSSTNEDNPVLNP